MALVSTKVLVSSTQDIFDEIVSAFTTAGWTLHHNISSTEKVFKSQGESETEIPGYVHLYISSSYIYTKTYLYWNSGTSTGTAGSYNLAGARIVSPPFNSTTYVECVGSKDGILVHVSDLASVTSYVNYSYWRYVGFVFPVVSHRTTTTQAIAAGSDVSFTVADASSIKVGQYYQLIGINYEGREKVMVQSVSGSTVTVQSVAASYDSGAYFGFNMQAFGHDYYTSGYRFWAVAHVAFDGAADSTLSTYYYQTDTPVATTSLDPENSSGHHYIQKPFVKENDGAPWTFPDGLKAYAVTGAYDDLFCVSNTNRDELCQVTSATTTAITDSTKSWGTDDHQGRYLVVSAGTGVKQSRKIQSNNGNTLQLVNPCHVQLDATSVFYIVDEVYRYVTSTTDRQVLPDVY